MERFEFEIIRNQDYIYEVWQHKTIIYLYITYGPYAHVIDSTISSLCNMKDEHVYPQLRHRSMMRRENISG